MSKFDPLWAYFRDRGEDGYQLTFGEIQEILGFLIDHSFLAYQKELLAYGYQVGRISIKQQTVTIEKSGGDKE